MKKKIKRDCSKSKRPATQAARRGWYVANVYADQIDADARAMGWRINSGCRSERAKMLAWAVRGMKNNGMRKPE
jgi:hypothetical protein